MHTTNAILLLAALLALSPVFAYEEAPVEDGARITGVIRLEGKAPPRKALEVFKHREVCGASVPDDSLVLGAEQGVRYAVVTLEGVKRGKAVERDTVNRLDNRECRFVPHIVTANVGQWLVLENSDPILHNADAYDLTDKKTLFNVALPPGKQVREPLARPGRIRVTCEVRHTWMQAFVVVTDHPYVTVTDAEGAFEIRDVPPGSYKLSVWHERLGSIEKAITVEKGGRHAADLKFAEQN